jgi:hemerythrin-like metal-binding protein
MSGRKQIPHGIYEALPYVYMVVGLLVLLILRNGLGVIGGLVLFSLGLFIWRLRWKHRNAPEVQMPVARPGEANPGLQSRRSSAQLVWRAEYESGHPVIDSQHRKLFEMGNAFLDAIHGRSSKLDLEMLLEELLAEIEDHFCTEETLMTRMKYPRTAEHQGIHRALSARGREMARQFHLDNLKPSDLFQFVAQDVVSEHVAKEDVRLLGGAD